MSASTLLLLAASFTTASAGRSSIDGTIAQVEQMPWSAETVQLAAQHGLSVVNVTWEDTGRYKGSSVGPNITDMTIGVRDSSGALHPMPVLRFDNFNDVTADLPADAFQFPVGNATGEHRLSTVSLTELLQDTRRFLHNPRSWKGNGASLWDRRDQEVLVSAQACFLPVPKSGEATFTPVVYNYQSSPGNPAVLTIIATREGTSIQVVENDSGYMSEPLFFNANGERAPFTAVRASDVAAGNVQSSSPSGSISAAGEDAANVVMMVQVPLKHRPNSSMYGWGGMVMEDAMEAPMAATRSASDVESAVIGHGETEGPFTEIHDLAIERDTRFPVRVTVQFYKATSNGVVTEQDVAAVREQIDRVYSDASYVGSLVTDGFTGRSTEWVDGPAYPVWHDPAFTGLKTWSCRPSRMSH